jgi:hypothetical protein
MNFLKEGKTNWKYILIVVILAVIVGGGILRWVNKQEISPTEFPQIPKKVEKIEDETADWKTYRNEEYGFEFKYPPTYLLKDQLAGEEKAVLLGDKEFPKPDIAPWYHSPISIGPTNQSRNTAMINSLVDKTTSFVEISGVGADVIEGKYVSYSGSSNTYRAKIIIIPEKELTIWIQEYYAGEISDWDSLSATTAKMLSTFRFIKEDETAGWKEKYGFDFIYPEDFKIKDMDQGVRIIFPDSYSNSSYIFKNDVQKAWIDFGIGMMKKQGFTSEFCKKLSVSDEEVKIDNLNFIKSHLSESAMGGWYTDYTIYHTLHGGKCYEISLAVEGKGPGAGANNGMGPLPEDYASSESKEKFISILNQILSTFRFIEPISDEITNWKTYENPEVNFTFKYPLDWEITDDYFYETAGGVKAKQRTVILREKGDENSNDWIRINPRQFQCSLGKCEGVYDNTIATYSQNSGIINVFNQILSTFRSLK